jgi:hypothetical protein
MPNQRSEDRTAESNPGQTRPQDPRQESPGRTTPNPFGDPTSPENEQQKRAPGSEQEYQGGVSNEKRTPGIEQDDRVDEESDRRKSA